MSVRKAHNAGRNHERNVLDYYQRMLFILAFVRCSYGLNHNNDLLDGLGADMRTAYRNRP